MLGRAGETHGMSGSIDVGRLEYDRSGLAAELEQRRPKARLTVSARSSSKTSQPLTCSAAQRARRSACQPSPSR